MIALQITYTESKESSQAKPNRDDSLGDDISLVFGLVTVRGFLSYSQGSHDDELE